MKTVASYREPDERRDDVRHRHEVAASTMVLPFLAMMVSVSIVGLLPEDTPVTLIAVCAAVVLCTYAWVVARFWRLTR